MKNNIITAGVDEVGRGCLAGPVVSAAVILNDKINLEIIKDSKKINFQNRLKIAEIIKQNSYYAIGIASVEEIFKINIFFKNNSCRHNRTSQASSANFIYTSFNYIIFQFLFLDPLFFF